MRRSLTATALLLSLLAPGLLLADPVLWGFKLGGGGRYDDVRMCVASGPGVKGGAAMEGAIFYEHVFQKRLSLSVHLPLVRPIMFGVAFKMLQFEPDFTLNFRHPLTAKLDLVYGPLVGLSFHYGPDYKSGTGEGERGPDFFAMGPKLGAVVALDFKRPGGAYNFQLGLSPYFIPLVGVDDSHAGVVAGGMLELGIRIKSGR